jgi:hypothetical protein
MKTFFRYIAEAVRKAATPAIAALLAASAVAMALTVPATYPPRQFQTEQTHYLRFTVNYNDCVLVSNACSLKRGAIPYNAFVIRAYQQIITNFNSGTSDTIGIGTWASASIQPVASGGGGLIVLPQSVHSGAGGATTLTVYSGSAGIGSTGGGDLAEGTDGGFDIYTLYVQASTAPTAGQAVYVIEYIAPNDGTCVSVPIGSTTAVAC